MKKRDNKKKILVILLLLIVGISVGYAALTTTLNINGNTTIEKATWDVHFENLVKTEGSVEATTEASIDTTKTVINFTISLLEPGDFYEFTTDIVNAGTIDAMISEVLKTGLSETQEKYLNYIVNYSDGKELQEKERLKSGATENITVRVEYKEDIDPSDLPTEEETLNLTFSVTYIQEDGTSISRGGTLLSKISKNAVSDAIQSTYVSSEKGIDFNTVSSETNGQGVYLLSSTASDINPIYYYRGAVDNNNVKFAGICWKIVRTTETGGVKLIYNGTPDAEGACTKKTGAATQIGMSQFNTSHSILAYVGYMYGVSNESYEVSHSNKTESTMKIYLEDWYKNNMTAYTEKLEDTIWCNDRSYMSSSGCCATTIYTTYYSSYSRAYYINQNPTFECKNDMDKFTVNTDNGNGTLTYPVGLITADELNYAGGMNSNQNQVRQPNSSFYLYTNEPYWTMSPYSQSNGNLSMVILSSQGEISATNVDRAVDGIVGLGVRPMISLKAGTVIEYGEGTSTDPYVIE